MSAGAAERTVELPPTARSAGRARHFVLDVLRRWGLDDLTDVAGLVTTEVVTNAVLHARTTVTVTVRREGAGVCVLVQDGSPHRPQRRLTTTESTSGRGMELLDRLAASWSVETTSVGKTVQFTLDPSKDPWGATTADTWLDEAEL